MDQYFVSQQELFANIRFFRCTSLPHLAYPVV